LRDKNEGLGFYGKGEKATNTFVKEKDMEKLDFSLEERETTNEGGKL